MNILFQLRFSSHLLLEKNEWIHLYSDNRCICTLFRNRGLRHQSPGHVKNLYCHICNFGYNKKAAVDSPFASYFFCFSLNDFRIFSIFDSFATVGYSFSSKSTINGISPSSFNLWQVLLLNNSKSLRLSKQSSIRNSALFRQPIFRYFLKYS